MLSKRFLAVGGVLLIIPLVALAFLRMRAASPQNSEPELNALPEAIANLQTAHRYIDVADFLSFPSPAPSSS